MAPSSKIREDAVVRYRHVPVAPRTSTSNIMSQSMPMAAMFLRNKGIAWAALFVAVQTWLNEPKNKPAETNSSSTLQPLAFQIIFSLIGLVTCYMDVIFPPPVRKIVETAAESTS